MTKNSFSEMNCPIAQTLKLVGEWWTLMILRNAFCGMTRFQEFHQHLGISTNILSLRLQRLTQHGIMQKQLAQDDARSFRYELTEKGQALYPVLAAMTLWGEQWAANPKGPRLLLVERKTQKQIAGVGIRSADGYDLQPSEIETLAGPGADEKTHELMRIRTEMK